MAVNSDPEKVRRLLTRGVERIYPNQEYLEKKLLSGERQTLYLGIDPTGPTLHLGSAIPLRKLREFQDLGHKIILLIGDFTARIGDPTGKLSARKVLTKADVKKNFATYKKQVAKILRMSGANKAEVCYNGTWLDRLTTAQFLGILGNFTTAQLLERDMFQERLREGKAIYANEFLYPVLQAYDSVVLDVDGELGGNDQTFNMLRGRDLMNAMKGKEKFVLTTRLLTDSSGQKMGKTEGNMVTLVDTHREMFGKVMSWSDGLIRSGFELCTDLDVPDERDIANDPRGMKMRLAHAIVRMYWGDRKADDAQNEWEKVFSKKELPDSIETFDVQSGVLLGEVLVAKGVVASKSAWRRLVHEGAVMNLDTQEKVLDEKSSVHAEMKLRLGKKRFVRIVIR